MIDTAAARHSVRSVVISCFSDNFAGLMLYTKLGFGPDTIDAVRGPGGDMIPRIRFRLDIEEEGKAHAIAETRR